MPIFSTGGSNPKYFAEIEISKQKFNICLDTGSAALWLPHPSCRDTACTKAKSFDFTKSTTFSTNHKPFLEAYGFGNISGIVATDNISMGGLTSQGQVFGLALHETSDFGKSKFDGIMGMSAGRINYPESIDAIPFFNSLVQQGVVEPMFSLYFGRKDGAHGQLTLGGYDSSLFEGSLQFNTLIGNNTGFWLIALEDVSVNGTPLNFKNKIAILDTGVPYIKASNVDAKTVHSSIDGAVEYQGVHLVPCNTTASVSLQFAGINYNITLAGGPVEGSDGLCLSGVAGPLGQENKHGSNYGNPNVWVVGVPFLKNVYAAFDVVNSRVGFALPKTQAV
ncbi:9262_t:CDS:2 [Paraglomus brasilianum]|uniref:9262_t:CDS:1 n=1 Tax=Paraglomus brasilianum TaxID=144538 RepID=A0A9N9DM15_9GLOM|nr:9262_t:CDS:2 [Paraglomus brasilianum]